MSILLLLFVPIIALAIVLGAVRIVIGIFSPRAAAAYGRAIEAGVNTLGKLFVVGLAVAILWFLYLAVTAPSP